MALFFVSLPLLLLIYSYMTERRKIFLYYAAHKFHVHFNYSSQYTFFSCPTYWFLKSLDDRRHSTNIKFPTNLFSSIVICPELLSRVSLNVLFRYTCFSVTFHIPFLCQIIFLILSLNVLWGLKIQTTSFFLTLFMNYISIVSIKLTHYIIINTCQSQLMHVLSIVLSSSRIVNKNLIFSNHTWKIENIIHD